jgi:Zn/Cd-binding protein ZinT
MCWTLNHQNILEMAKGHISLSICKEALDNLWANKVEADQEKEIKREERYAKSYALDKERLELDKEIIAIVREKLSNEANNI